MRAVSLALAGLLWSGSAGAGETVIYRCTAADGSVALQSMPCPAGSRSEVRRLSADYAPPALSLPPSPLPEPAPTPSPATPEHTAAPAASSTASGRAKPLPLPVLHHCQPRSGTAYYTDRLEETVRCVPLRVTGLDGNPATAAGQACEVQRDRCQSVAEADACHAWGLYLKQSQERFASAPSRSSSKADTQSAQIAALLAGSHCSQALDQKP
ncbi:hypothetical protein ABXT00_03250 [Stenotrophomonas koreensis]|uniref:hypothetical protein n=1 Tax=Stenotrophomonas koreensis TaxID=266128 RepID=UPI003392140E